MFILVIYLVGYSIRFIFVHTCRKVVQVSFLADRTLVMVVLSSVRLSIRPGCTVAKRCTMGLGCFWSLIRSCVLAFK